MVNKIFNCCIFKPLVFRSCCLYSFSFVWSVVMISWLSSFSLITDCSLQVSLAIWLSFPCFVLCKSWSSPVESVTIINEKINSNKKVFGIMVTAVKKIKTKQLVSTLTDYCYRHDQLETRLLNSLLIHFLLIVVVTWVSC